MFFNSASAYILIDSWQRFAQLLTVHEKGNANPSTETDTKMFYQNFNRLNYVLLSFLLLGSNLCFARESLKFGFISPTDGPYGYRTSAAATTMAIEKAKKDGLWQDVDVT